MSKMISRVPLNAVVVQRDGKNVTAKAGKAFEFTEAEVADIAASDKAKGRETLREPVNEGGADPKVLKAQQKLVSLVAKVAEATTDKAKADAKAAVRKFCQDNGIDVPDGMGEAGDL